MLQYLHTQVVANYGTLKLIFFSYSYLYQNIQDQNKKGLGNE